MHWPLPVLLVLLVIGFSNSQTTAGDEEELNGAPLEADPDLDDPLLPTSSDDRDEITMPSDKEEANAEPTESNDKPETETEAEKETAVETATTAEAPSEAPAEAPATEAPADPVPESEPETPEVTTTAVSESVTESQTLPEIIGEKDGEEPVVTKTLTKEATTVQELKQTTVVDKAATTETPTETPTTEPEPTTAKTPCYPEGDPCCVAIEKTDVERHYTTLKGLEPIDDRSLESGWYRFKYEGENAIITPDPIKPGQCGTTLPYHLHNLKEMGLPKTNETLEMTICGTAVGEKGYFQCVEQQKIKVKKCEDFFVYYLGPLKFVAYKEAAAICIQKPTEIVEVDYLAIFPDEPRKSNLPQVSVDDLTFEQLNGTVTTELNCSENDTKSDTFLEDLDKVFRPLVARALNNLTRLERPDEEEEDKAEDIVDKKEATEEKSSPPEDSAPAPDEEEDNKKKHEIPDQLDADADLKGPRAAAMVGHPRQYRRDLSRHKRSSGYEYTADDVHYVGPTPRVNHGVLQVAVFVDDPETEVVDAARLEQALENANDNGEIEADTNLPVKDIYQGLPRDIQPLVMPSAPVTSTWDKHKALFITIIVLLILLLLILLIGCLCIKCRNKRGSWTANPERPRRQGDDGRKSPKKPLTAHESPLADDEIKKDEAHMTEKDNPAYTANGSGGHISKPSRDEEGWIVPIDELNRAERNRPDVQDTRF